MLKRGEVLDVETINEERLFRELPERLRQQVLFACLIGSYAEGLATITSDMDVMLVHQDSVSRDEFLTAHYPAEYDGVRIDIIIFSKSEILKLLKSGQGDLTKLSARQMEFVHKVLKGRAILNIDYYHKFIANFDYNTFKHNVFLRHLWVANDQYTDLIGLMHGYHLREAAETARSLTRSYIDAFLALCGETYPRSKWRLRKLERSLSPQSIIFCKILDIEFGGTSQIDEESLWTLIYKCLAAVRMLQICCYFGGELLEFLTTSRDFGDESRRLNQVEKLGEKFVVRSSFDERVVDPLTALCILIDERYDDDSIHTALKLVKFDENISLQSIARRRQAGRSSGFLLK
jgi:predicted nucleotidyltransferase